MVTDRHYFFFLLMIVMMSSANLIATDIYLPALPEMAQDFHCSQSAIQTTVTIFLLGFASCQMIAGMLADRFDRQKVALIGFTFFTLSSLLCAYSTTLQQFCFFRLLQAWGGGVGSVISRTLIADNYNKEESVKIFSTIFPIIGLSTAFTPFIGGYLSYFLGWRATFLVTALFGFGILLTIFYYSRVYLTKDPLQKISVPQVTVLKAERYWEILKNREFLGFVLIICASFCVFRSFAVESPFVFHKEGYTVKEIGRFYTTISITYVLGNLIARKLIHKMASQKILNIGMFIFTLGGICMIASALLYPHQLFAILIPMFMITLANGFLFPLGSAGAMSAIRKELAGTASGMMGAMQYILAAICINWVDKVCQGEALILSIFIGTIILIALSSHLLLRVYKAKTQIAAT